MTDSTDSRRFRLARDLAAVVVAVAGTWAGHAFATDTPARIAAGQISAVVVDPQVPTTLYAVTECGGVLKSSAAAETWSPANTGLPADKAVFALAVDPAAPSTLYAGTEADGVFKSTDGGGSWTAANAGLTGAGIVRALTIDPVIRNTLYAVVQDFRIFKSNDAANSWNAADVGLGNVGNVFKVVIDPTHSATLYAATGAGVFKSTDGAGSWHSIGSGLSGAVFALAVDPMNPATLYAGTFVDFFKSTDSGRTWVAASEGIPAIPINGLAVDPVETDTLYAATDLGGVFKSSDGAASWQVMKIGLTDTTIPPQPFITTRFINISPAMHQTLYTLTNDALFESADGAATWHPITALATNPICGDGLLCGFERCDDGNLTNGDGCDSNCTPTGCGNGIITAGEECDDTGNPNPFDGCTSRCTICGNGTVTPPEECDDGNSSDDDACTTACRHNVCGDGFLNPATEECDDGTCEPECKAPRCGNGILAPGEECDDGNTDPFDGCTAACTICGNPPSPFHSEPVTPPEECEDGNRTNDDGCDANCTFSRCGNDVVNEGEECDDGNTDPFDGCTAACTVCGDGIVTPPEECDDGGSDRRDGCTSACTLCGNGVVTSPELCDDGNLVDGDACNARCSKLGAALTVTKSADSDDGVCDGDCSLREAIIATNQSPGADTIRVPAGTYHLASEAGDLAISDDLTVIAMATGAATLQIDSALDIGNDAAVSLVGLTIQGNGISNAGRLTLTDCILRDEASDSGGTLVNQSRGVVRMEGCLLSRYGIVNNGVATFTTCTFSGDTATAITNFGPATFTDCSLTGKQGTAIVNGGALTLTDCSLSDNSGNLGGAIFNYLRGSLNLEGCTLNDNSAAIGGGIYNDSGAATLTNCTLSRNSAGLGGGIFNNDSITLTNCTLSDNAAERSEVHRGNGGGIYNAGVAAVRNTIIANSAIGGACAVLTVVDSPLARPLNSAGYNLDDDGSCTLAGIGDLPSTPAQLAPLARYGSEIETHALCTGVGMPHPACSGRSPAIDAGNDALCPDTDQRGAPRNGAACDIGAYEGESHPPPYFCHGDCDGDTRITVDELIIGVNVALGNAPIDDCHSLDSNSDRRVTVDELIEAIDLLLVGCS